MQLASLLSPQPFPLPSNDLSSLHPLPNPFEVIEAEAGSKRDQLLVLHAGAELPALPPPPPPLPPI